MSPEPMASLKNEQGSQIPSVFYGKRTIRNHDISDIFGKAFCAPVGSATILLPQNKVCGGVKNIKKARQF